MKYEVGSKKGLTHQLLASYFVPFSINMLTYKH